MTWVLVFVVGVLAVWVIKHSFALKAAKRDAENLHDQIGGLRVQQNALIEFVRKPKKRARKH